MKRKLLPAIVGLLGAVFMTSCGSDSPAPVDNPSNAQIFQLMEDNYFWKPLPANVDKKLDPVQYFNALLSPEDKYTVRGETFRYSWIASANNASVSYDPGFEYAANRYTNGDIFYVVYYVKPGSSADAQQLRRGYLITSVNGVKITNENKNTLLRDAMKQNPSEIKLVALNPVIGKPLDFTITATQNSPEDPILLSKVIPNTKVGYIAYNMFRSGKSNGTYDYDNQLMNILQDFVTLGVDNLVLDLRYNVGGAYPSAQALGSAIVKNRNTKNTFIEFIGSTTSDSYPFVDNTKGGTAVPKLGDKLKKVYIITGQNTAGMPETFINALKPYLGSDLVLVGEKTQGRNIATAMAKTPNGQWILNMALGKYADKDKKSDYAQGFTPNLAIADVNPNIVTILGELGAPNEAILSSVLSLIGGGSATRSVEVSDRNSIKWSSLQEKSMSIQSNINLDELN